MPMIINIKDCKTILELIIITELLIKIWPNTRKGIIKVCSEGNGAE